MNLTNFRPGWKPLVLLLALPLMASTVRIIQTNSAGDDVSIIDPSTNKVVGTIHGIEVNHGAAVAPDGSRYYISDEADRTLDAIDTKSLKIIRRVPLTGSFKAYVVQPGRTIGHFAWVPTRFSPYVGAGGGVMWYRFAQRGDFIDFNTFRVFPDAFDSNGFTPTVHGFGGIDISLHPRFAFTTEARYEWAKGNLISDFAGFNRIDLSGFTLTTGISVRY